MDQLAKKILTLSPYGSYAPTTGGTKRIHYLNRGYAKAGWSVTQISGASIRKGVLGLLSNQSKVLSDNYVEHIYFNPFVIAGNRILRHYAAPQIATSILPRFLMPHRQIAQEIKAHTVIVLEHPQYFEFAEPYLADDHLLVLDAHNIEAQLFRSVQDKSDLSGWAARKLLELERRCMRRADIVFTCSEADRDIAIEEYGTCHDKVQVAPNGVDIASMEYATETDRSAAKKRLGISGNTALFVGSNWQPNIEAANLVIELAPKSPETTFCIVGSVGDGITRNYPGNVLVTGMVEDLSEWFAAADLAVNPMLSGSGSNIKMFEYCAAGLPTVSTHFGARGINDPTGLAIITSELDHFPQSIENLLSARNLPLRREAARDLAVKNYDWKAIAQTIIDRIESELSKAG